MSEFVDHLSEVFERLGEVKSRRMFGGHGIYYDGIMIGLVADDVLYLKADDQTSALFTDRGLHPFEFVKNDKRMTMSYYLAPEAIFDDPEIAMLWARRAHEAAIRSKKPKSRKK